VIEFRINLIRDQVPTASERRQRYWGMIAYLGVAGLLVVLALGKATSRMLDARQLRVQIELMESRFLVEHEGSAGIRKQAARLQRALGEEQLALQRVETQLASTARPARLLNALHQALPSGVLLRGLTVSEVERSASFELVVLGGRAQLEGSSSDLLLRIQQNRELAAHLTDIAFLGSQMEANAARRDTIWRFSGRLQRKDA